MNRYEQMREALDRIGNIAGFVAENCGDQQTAKYMNDIISEVLSAIATPPRNCDVGTVEEQIERFLDYCLHKKDVWNCMYCHNPPRNLMRCLLEWAQMPYEAKEGAGE